MDKPFGACPHCGEPRPYRFIGGFHCHDAEWRSRYGESAGPVNWFQRSYDGLWPSDWPVS